MAHYSDEQLYEKGLEALSVFFGTQECSIQPTEHGSNNWVYYIDKGASKFVLRLYNNNKSTGRVKAEHAILATLSSIETSFKVPMLVPVPDETVATYVILECGMCACLFTLLPGVSPGGDTKHTQAMGKATGELMNALSLLYSDSKTAMDTRSYGPAPYYDLWHVHASITKESFYAFCDTCGELQDVKVRGGLTMLLNALKVMEEEIKAWQSMEGNHFPLSFVHGDLVTDNFLVSDADGVTGIIDFEFVGEDWRIMELATSLSKFPEDVTPIHNLSLFARGFHSTFAGKLSPAEVRALPSMIRLRMVSNVIYFVGRVLSGEAKVEYLVDRVPGYCRRLKWLDMEENSLALRQLFE